MLIYEGTKDNFLSSVEQDTIAVEIENNIYERMHRHTAKNEFRAWENSMEYMYKVLNILSYHKEPVLSLWTMYPLFLLQSVLRWHRYLLQTAH